MKRPILILILLSFSLFCGGQSINKDSLKAIWNDPNIPDTTRLDAMTNLAWNGFLFSQPDSAYYFAQLQYDFAKKRGLTKRMAKAVNMQGISFWIQGDFTSAIESYNRSLEISQEIGDRNGIANSTNNIGIIYKDQGDFSRAIDYYTQSLTIFEELEDYVGIARALNNIGIIYDDQDDYHKAIEYYDRSLPIFEKIGDKRGVAVYFHNVARIYGDLNNMDSAMYYYYRCLPIFKEIKDKQGIANALLNIGSFNHERRNNDSAIVYFNRSLKVFEEIGDKKGMSESLNGLGIIHKEYGDSVGLIGNVLYANNQYNRAIAYGTKALELAQEVGAALELRNVARSLYKTYQAANRTEQALQMLELYIATKDSIQSEENRKEVIRQEFKYNYEKQNLADNLAHQAALNHEANRRLALYILLILLGLFSAYVFRAWRIRRNLSQKLQLSYSQLKELDEYKESMTAMIIHDFKNSLNTVISFSEDTPTQRRLQGINQAGKFMLNMVLNMLDVQKFETTNIKLSPADFPVSKVINQSIEQLGYLIDQKSVQLIYTQMEELYCRVDFELIVRCIVNILSNAIKFVPTNGKIEISTEKRGDAILLSIQDNGPGIPEDKIDRVFDKYSQLAVKKSGSVRSTGIGLTFCKMVVEAHHGDIGVESTEGQGSTFYFTLPVIECSGDQQLPIEKINIPHEKSIDLSENEKLTLKPFIKELKQWEVYDYSEVVFIIENIDDNASSNIRLWKERMMKTLHNGNEEHFKDLLDI